ncbi:LytTR family transcriptional regulator DNA-binding domain-containing protein [Pseudarcicella hirudinis]|uniref:LytTR family transcriptional regulator DNA-binding domain-containing protein n=1 Tax=Pseudarcicella hirudinis TaxID=1079859 RepID=UPI0035E5ABDF
MPGRLKRMKELADLDFVRVHKSHLINLNYLLSYDRENATFLKLKDQKQVLISRRKRKSFQERLNNFEWSNN